MIDGTEMKSKIFVTKDSLISLASNNVSINNSIQCDGRFESTTDRFLIYFFLVITGKSIRNVSSVLHERSIMKY